jgi:serine/threonine protein phosphatase PrpC
VERVRVPQRSLQREPGPRREFRFVSAAISHPGRARANNEDFVFAGETLVAVADGVGGSVYGEVASEVAVNAIAYLEDAGYTKEPQQEMADAAGRANEQLRRAIEDDRSRHGMATTLTALRLDGPSVAVLHVGDSRAYLVRGGALLALSHDDSLVQALVDVGAITADEARHHPARSVVLRALNGEPVQPHVTVTDAQVGDRVLLCTDGLSDYVEDAAIAAVLAAHREPADCCEELLRATLGVGAPDNVSCVVADIVPVAPIS